MFSRVAHHEEFAAASGASRTYRWQSLSKQTQNLLRRSAPPFAKGVAVLFFQKLTTSRRPCHDWSTYHGTSWNSRSIRMKHRKRCASDWRTAQISCTTWHGWHRQPRGGCSAHHHRGLWDFGRCQRMSNGYFAGIAFTCFYDIQNFTSSPKIR